MTATPIESLAETALALPPPTATTSPVLERGARASGRSPLALWFTRPVAADAVDVALRLIDPLGRAVEQTLTIPGWTPPPEVHLQLVRVIAVAGRGVIFVLYCDAPVEVSPPYVMEVRAVQRPRFPTLLRGGPGGRTGPLDWPSRGTVLEDSEPLDAIPFATTPFHPGPWLQIVRYRPSGDAAEHGNYGVWVPLPAPVSIVVSVVAPDGGRVSVDGAS